MNWLRKRSLVVGAGRSGLAAVQKLRLLGADVYLTDIKGIDQLTGVKELGLPADHLLLGRMIQLSEISPEIIVLSPGVPTDLPFIQEAMALGTKIWGEVELALHDCSAFKIGITGTNGKTTTTSLTGELVKRTGQRVTIAGNIGIALSGQVEDLTANDYVVAELSSFQLEYFDELSFNVGIVLNITPDHLDRHKTIERYIEAKRKIFNHQQASDVAILNWDDPIVRQMGEALKSKIFYFSPTSFLTNGMGLKDETIVWANDREIVPLIHRRSLQLRGTHNLENVMASMLAAHVAGVSWDEIVKGVAEFKGVPHRQEFVGRFDDIVFINDSKGTNPDAAAKALLAFDEPIVLIAGGKNKGLSFDPFMKLVKEKVKTLVLLGAAAADMEASAKNMGVKHIVRASSFPEGVELGIANANPGDVVLLSPACTSWDMFNSYEERGELFKELVRNHYSEPK